MSPTQTVRSAPDWRDATAGTITRIQQIFDLNPALTEGAKREYYTLAHEIAVAQHRTSNATEYWGTFANILRTLIAGATTVDPNKTFD